MATDKCELQKERELYELKQKAMQYYSENGVPQKMEEILNSTFFDAPNDVYGHLSNFFEKYSIVPTITKIKATEASDSRGQTAILTELYCTVKNFEKLVVTTISNNENRWRDAYATKPEEKEAIEAGKHKNLEAMIEFIEKSINSCLQGLDPVMQADIDYELVNIFEKLRKSEEKLAKEKEESSNSEMTSVEETKVESVSPAKGKKVKSPRQKSPKGKRGAHDVEGKGGKAAKEVVIIPDVPAENLICGCSAVSVVSQAVCQAASAVTGTPLYEHIASLRFDEKPSKYCLPQAMCTILCSGKNLPGKQNCVKEYMVVPRPGMPFKKAFCYIRKIYQHCGQVMNAKSGAAEGSKPSKSKGKKKEKKTKEEKVSVQPQESGNKEIDGSTTLNVNEIGALCPTYDKPEQGLDILQDAISAQGLTPGEDFHIALNCAGHEIFDYEKGKYEVMTGVLKSAEELGDFWGDILDKYPSVIALIDPMRSVEKQAWMKLCERLTERCYVVGEEAVSRPGKLKDAEVDPEFKTSGVVFKVDGMNTITDILTCAKKMEDASNQVILAGNNGEGGDTFVVDLALGMNARFIKLGAPNRGERILKYNHLLQRESQLSEGGKLGQFGDYTFELIKPPTPPPPPEGEQETPIASPSKHK